MVDRVEVVLGAHNVREIESSQVIRHSSQVIIHPGWNPSTLVNDVALIHLTAPVAFNSNISPIRLPSHSQLNNNFANSPATVSGWGLPSDSATAISPVLRFINQPVITNLICNLRFFGAIQSSHICTSGDGGRSTCSVSTKH
ncbi:unnamed protein product [Timema podura]|uniref:Peptidase S1 domain-containing protein n=1 Tax=Timema podura TaxID=61482 RepID=A0ABN7PU03_TIMPD|nr:unnamed protein product [Timema podura]